MTRHPRLREAMSTLQTHISFLVMFTLKFSQTFFIAYKHIASYQYNCAIKAHKIYKIAQVCTYILIIIILFKTPNDSANV